MYIKTCTIVFVRCLKKLKWDIKGKEAPGWHVIIGDNGSGKSSMLRSIALAFVGPAEAIALGDRWNDWLSEGESTGRISLNLDYEPNYDKFSRRGRRIKNFYLLAAVRFIRENGSVKLITIPQVMDPNRHVWGGKSGWFSASYGPFRRFTGGDPQVTKMFYSSTRLARHLSIFGEEVALTESLAWLQLLQYQRLENDPQGCFLDRITKFVNQRDFLPFNTRLRRISSKGVFFVDGNGCEVVVDNLSDGFRSVLSLTFELIRQLASTFGYDRVFDERDPTKVGAPGVVLIDEVDAHLHPTWKRNVGFWFQKYFPKLQFLVTTHSPLVCQAAEKGTIFRLSQPGSNEESRMMKGHELDRLVYGNVMDAYSTDAFGSGVTRSEASKRLLAKLAELNVKETREELSTEELEERDNLRRMMPTAADSMKEQ